MLPDTLAEFLTLAMVAPLMGFFQSYIVELWPGWANIPPQWKRMILLAVSVGLAVGVQTINTYAPGEFLLELEPWYLVVVVGLELVGAEVTHQKLKK